MSKSSIVVAVVIMLLLAGCGNTAALPEPDIAEGENLTDALTTTEEEVAADTPITAEEELKEEINVHVSDNQYDNVWAISEEYLLFKENDRYGVIDKEENIIFPAEYDGFHSHMQGDSFMIYTKEGDIKHNILFDSNLNIIYEDDSEYYISSYSENIICMANDEGSSRKYLDAGNSFEVIAILNKDIVDGYDWSSPCNNGLIVISDYTYDDQGFDNYMDISGNIMKLPMFEDGTFAVSRRNAINIEGWFAVDKFDLSNGTGVSSGFYNVHTGKYVEAPIMGAAYDYQTEENGVTTCTVVDGKIGIVTDTHNDASVYAIYDLEQEKYLTDGIFLYINLNDAPFLLYQNVEEEWGFVDDEFHPVGETYEDACSFQNGYAIIHVDGGEYFINTDFQIVSEQLEGESAATMGNGFYKIMVGERCYFAYIEK